MPTPRLDELLKSDLVYFKENEINSVKELRQLNRALVERLKVTFSYFIR